MSYKFPVYRCSLCGVVSFDPPMPVDPETGNDLDRFTCGIVRDNNPGSREVCGGIVTPFALMDADTFIIMLE